MPSYALIKIAVPASSVATRVTLHGTWATGCFLEAREQFQDGTRLIDVGEYTDFIEGTGLDLRVQIMNHDALTLWTLGYADQAADRSEAAVAHARELGHPFTLALALVFATLLRLVRAEWGMARAMSSEAAAMTARFEFSEMFAIARCLDVLCNADPSKPDQTADAVRQALAALSRLHSENFHVDALVQLAEFLASAGRFEEARECVERAEAHSRKSGGNHRDAEVRRPRGSLLDAQGIAGAEAFYLEALEIARPQGARSFELRAATSLAGHLRERHKPDAAREALTETYEWFTEGFDTADLRSARALLTELGQSQK